MKENIISNMEILLGELTQDDNHKEKWEDFLVCLAEAYGSVNLKEKLKEPLANLLQYVDETSLIKGMEFLDKKIDDFPVMDVLKALIGITGEMRREKEASIKELKDILSELATPVIRVWKDILLLPLIGSLDSDRAQSMAEKLLDYTADTRAKVVIIDVTGVPMIDTIVGGFLIEMFNAVKLLGSDVVLTGIKPEIAHTLVKLGVDFNMVTIKRDLESALKYAISKTSESNPDRKRNRKRGIGDEE